MNVQNEALKRFIKVLVKKGLYKEGEKLIINDEKEQNRLIDKWQEAAKNFIYKGIKVKAWMYTEQDSNNDTICDLRVDVVK